MTKNKKRELMALHWNAVWFGQYDLARLIYRFLATGTCTLYFADADYRLELILQQLGVKMVYTERGNVICYA